MSTKSKKQQQQAASAATATSTTIEVVVPGTPQSASATASQSTPGRPVSPARLSRIQERAELQNLNDRLAAYIERNRQLESENSKLKIQVKKTQESREIHSIKKLYESELGDTRSSLDTIAKEKAQAELLLSRAQEELKKLETKLNKKNAETVNLEKKLANQDAQTDDLRNKINQGIIERKRLETDIKSLNDENKSLDDKLEALKKQLEEETLLRVDLENRNQSLNEELQFQRQLYNKELEEVRLKEFEYKEIYQENIKDQYQQKLNKELDELRAENEERFIGYRQEIESKYEERLLALHDQLDRKVLDLDTSNARLKQLNSTYTFVNSEVEQLKRENENLKNKVDDFNKLIEQERQWNKIELQRKEEELDALRAQLEALMEERKDLIDDKIKLDSELAIYRKLLEGEETRLNISPTVSSSPLYSTSETTTSSSKSTPKSYVTRGNKSKHICLQEEENLVDIAVTSNATGDIEIFDQDQDGKFVKLKNKGTEKDVSLGGWQLVRYADGLETRYKFHRTIALKPGSIVTVWSSDANGFHQPPNEIVMKAQTWFVADKMTTALFNNSGEEVATRTTEKKITSFSQRVSSGYYDGVPEANDQQKCAVM